MSEIPVVSTPTIDNKTAWKRAFLATLGFSMLFLGAVYTLFGGVFGFFLLTFGNAGSAPVLRLAAAIAMFIFGSRMFRHNVQNLDAHAVTAMLTSGVGMAMLIPDMWNLGSGIMGDQSTVSVSLGTWAWVVAWFGLGVMVMKTSITNADKAPTVQAAAVSTAPQAEALPQPPTAPKAIPTAELSVRNRRLRLLGKISTVLGWIAIAYSMLMLVVGSLFGAVAFLAMMFGDTTGILHGETADSFGSFVGALFIGVVLLIAGRLLKTYSNKPQ